MGRRVIFTLNIDNYAPGIRALTRPLLERYAKYAGYDICDINSRAFPDWDVDLEKLQIYNLMKEYKIEFAWYIDSDAAIHPDLPPLHNLVPRDHCAHNGSDLAPVRWRYTDDGYFQRDGRNIGSCCWNIVAWDWTRDVFHPPDISFNDAMKNIRIIEAERQSGVVTPAHLVTDYIVSRNIARYGLKYVNLNKWLGSGDYFFHLYTVPIDEKIVELRRKIKSWGL